MTTSSPTRKDRRDQARRERVQREQAEAARAARRRRFVRLGAVLAAAAVVVVVLVAVSSSGGGKTAGSSSSASSSVPVAGVRASSALLAGIPQKGLVLGRADAPVRVVEFADLQCPFCRDYALGVMPGLVQKYVRTGKARMEFNTLAFIGPDSVRLGRLAEAAAGQNKLWNVVDLAYHNQGAENSGYATDAFLRRVTAAVPGLDVAQAMAARPSATVTAQLKAAADNATTHGVNETPTFLVGRGANLKAVDAAGLPAALKAAAGS